MYICGGVLAIDILCLLFLKHTFMLDAAESE